MPSNIPEVKPVSNPMEVFTKFCCICFDKNAQLLQLHERSKEELSYLNKLLIAVPEMNFAELNGLLLICNECKLHIEQIYWFRKMCLRNKTTLMKYLVRISRKRKPGFRSTIRVVNIDKLRKAEVEERPKVAEKVLMVKITDEVKLDIPIASEVKDDTAPVLNPIEIPKNDLLPMPVDRIKQEPVDEVANEAESEPMSFEYVYCKKEVDIYEDFENTYVNNIKCEPEEEKKTMEPKTEVVKVDLNKSTDSSEHNYSHTDLDPDPATSKNEETKSEKINCDKTAVKPVPNSENVILQEHSYAFISVGPLTIDDKTQLSKLTDVQTCKLCKKTFTHLRTLNAHWCRAHLKTKPYSCNLCDKSFLNFGHLRLHREVHKGCRFYYCSTCDKPFVTLTFLKKHLEMHAGEAETNMTCDVCKRTFRRLGPFKRHLLTHKNEKKNTCGDCKKSFPSVEQLREHQRNHIGIRPFTCDVCKKSFTTAVNLYTHQDLHGHK